MIAFTLAHMKIVPPVGAVLGGAAIAVAAALMPPAMLEGLVRNGGIAALIPAAAPPLGSAARAVLALGGGAVAAAMIWSALYLLFGQGGLLAGEGKPVVRRADAHPDAPPRWPMSAADLGTPLMEVERPIPADLEQPLAAFDPGSILASPMEPVRPVAPLVQTPPPPSSPSSPLPPPLPLARGERIETFELTPVVRFDTPRAAPPASPSIETLLRRLEEGARRREARAG